MTASLIILFYVFEHLLFFSVQKNVQIVIQRFVEILHYVSYFSPVFYLCCRRSQTLIMPLAIASVAESKGSRIFNFVKN